MFSTVLDRLSLPQKRMNFELIYCGFDFRMLNQVFEMMYQEVAYSDVS